MISGPKWYWNTNKLKKSDIWSEHVLSSGLARSLQTVDDPEYIGESGIGLSTLISTGADIQFILANSGRWVRFAWPFAFHFVSSANWAPLVRAEGLHPDGQRARSSPSLSPNVSGEWRAMRSFRVTFGVSLPLYCNLGSTCVGGRASPRWPADWWLYNFISNCL